MEKRNEKSLVHNSKPVDYKLWHKRGEKGTNEDNPSRIKRKRFIQSGKGAVLPMDALKISSFNYAPEWEIFDRLKQLNRYDKH